MDNINEHNAITPEKFQTPFTEEEKKKQGFAKKISGAELITQEIPFPADSSMQNYFKIIQTKTREVFDLAEKAKKTSVDLTDFVEVTPAVDLADRAETIIGLPGLAKRFREIMSEQKDRRKSYFQLFKEILEQKWWKIPDESKRVETAIKTCLLIETEGVVVAPLDGVPKVEINTNPDGSRYVDIYFAGPIRAAGGSSTVIPLILGDYARRFLGLDRYKPTQDEVERYVEEIGIYQTEVISRQYMMADEEIRIIINGCPICINGVPTEEVEVSAHRDLQRVPTNRIRGGMGLVVSEGLALKALWVMKTARELGLDWSFLEKIVKVEKTQTKIEVKPNKAFLDRLAAGRPIISYPSAWGGFRLRYGRGRNTGIMAKAINPATMILLDEFIAVGTHGRIERPGKATQFFPCTTIEGPIVLLKDGSVEKINTKEQAENVKAFVEKILYVGDLLATYGDFKKSAHPLVPAGYCEEWWQLELKKICEDRAKKQKLAECGLEKFLSGRINELQKITEEEALLFCQEFGVPLHPQFLNYYRALNIKEIISLREYLLNSKIENKEGKIRLVVENNPECKKMLEKIGVPHRILDINLVIDENVKSFIKTFALEEKKQSSSENVLEYLSELSGLVIRDKAGSFIGGRMGRPEQAKPRQMKGNPHVLFPIGLKGGSTRSINKAIDPNHNENGKVTVEISEYYCPQCKKISINPICITCKIKGARLNYCKSCGKSVTGENCGVCGGKTMHAGEHEVDLRSLVEHAQKNISEPILPDIVKGVKGMIAEVKEAEPLEKGILRAKHDVHIFRDGTSRFELLNAGITHFKPLEIGLSIERVKELGYTRDIHGDELTTPNQLIEIYPQDIIVNEACGEWLVKVSKFCDDLLEKFYKQPKYYNAKTKEDLIGHIVLGLAPHTSAAVNARILGYTKARLGFGHPYFVCAKRRNCLDGKEHVMIQRKGRLELIQISELSDGKDQTILNDVKAFAVSAQGKVILRDAPLLIRKKAPKSLLRLRTRSGRKIIVTPEHKMLVETNARIVDKEASALKAGEKLIALNSKIPFEKNDELNVINYYLSLNGQGKKTIRMHGSLLKNKIKEYGYAKISKAINYRSGKAIHTAFSFDAVPLDLYEKIIAFFNIAPEKNTFLSYAKQKSRVPAVIQLSKEFGEIIGLYLSDGCARTTNNGTRKKYVYQVNIVSKENEITQKIRQFALSVLGRKICLEKRKTVDCITLSGRVYFDLFSKILNLRENAKNKRVSPQLINSNEAFIKGLIGGYIVGDGHIDKNSIKISSVNKELINGFSLLLTQCGALPHFTEENRAIKTGLVADFYLKKGKQIRIHSYNLRLYSTDLIKVGKSLFGQKKGKYDAIIKLNNFRHKRETRFGDFAIDELKEAVPLSSATKYVYDLIVEGEKNFIAGFGQLGVYDCDGDQDALMLLMDSLLNFSNKYLSMKSGGRMDAPLVFTIIINPSEVDDEVHKMETCWDFPLDLYEKSANVCEPSIDIESVKERLEKPAQYSGIGFTHDTEIFDEGPKTSRYIQLKTMDEKIQRQNALQKKILAVNAKDALEKVMGSHFLPDIIGNARAFSRQTFRCTSCNEKYRRIPLSGKCYKCGKPTLILTIHEGSVRKYLKIAQTMAVQENLSPYLLQRLNMIEKEINSVFKSDTVKQKSLFEFA